MHTDLRNTDIKKFWTRSNLTFFLLPVIDPMSSFSYNIRPVCRLRTFRQFLKRLLFILTYITKVIRHPFKSCAYLSFTIITVLNAFIWLFFVCLSGYWQGDRKALNIPYWRSMKNWSFRIMTFFILQGIWHSVWFL